VKVARSTPSCPGLGGGRKLRRTVHLCTGGVRSSEGRARRIDAAAVTAELTGYLEEGWDSVIESDVDGPNSLPMRLDRENPALGRYSAARRVARTI
jgi:hypothetical protein